ncbi:copper amine oxidase [Talaromyces proteolyticus]|uniref:Amine oxidase n=1 Tax=Talaromyces proteolyticus TaxID=1131652 RepID=A0AAD4Q3A7_9EURO|nr:copper amine oxidase [Talaromyces proteolyticus]KAH8701543.1 copper amine oxidase [Talaromyces proteolyticus]
MIFPIGLFAFILLLRSSLAVPRVESTAWKRISKSKPQQRTDSWLTTVCVNNHAATITAPKQNVWNSLTDTETAAVTQWLFAQSDLNLTKTSAAGDWDNTVLLVELMYPNKTNALTYIDQNGPEPARFAHVVIAHRASVNPYYADILVGPLPVQNGTTQWENLEYPYTRKTQGRVRNLEASENKLTEWLFTITGSISDITLELWNGTAFGLQNDTISLAGISPFWQDDGRIIGWYTFSNLPTGEFDSASLLPLGLSFKVDITGRDPSEWKLEGWLYNNVFYENTHVFRAAFNSPDFVKLGANVDGSWTSTDQQGPILPRDTSYPPAPVAPTGSRYSVDGEQKYVTWMDFSFYLGFSRDTGLTLYDVRFKGDRILYELGLQEALAHYAGIDPVTSGTAYLDSFSGFGLDSFELLKGYDCPVYATYLNSSAYISETSVPYLNNICLFEFDADFPIQRHTSTKYASSTKNVYFTVRSVSTVGNYDYLFSYSFFLDGSISVEVRASGYIHGAFYAQNDDFGYRIHDYLSGSMHDHVLNFKADFDILGEDNTVQFIRVVPVNRSFTWSGNKARNTMMLERSFLENEDSSRFNWDPNSATQVLVVNTNKKTKFGEFPGYRIAPYTGTAHLTVQDSSNLVNSAQWAGYDLQVTKQHDTEPRSAHPYNLEDVYDPPINFDTFFDGENLTQTDLVVWFNLGMHHLPHTGDLPNTVFTTAHSGIQFIPSNFLSSDASRQTVNQVRVEYSNGNASILKAFGQDNLTCHLDFVPAEIDLSGYRGEPAPNL